MRNISFIFILLHLIMITNQSFAVEPEEIMNDTKNEIRARNISKQVRCLVCQNQSIDDSSAQLAKDLRIIIRKKIKEGSNDKEIYEFLVNRYGEFILLNPKFNGKNFFLWIFPFAFLIGCLFLIIKGNKKALK